jgi:HAT1-interacting factor 1
VDGDEGDEAEPEDDFNAAWEVLDLARAIYEKGKDEDNEVKLKLADTYITLGDISLETGPLSWFIMCICFTTR